MSFARNLAFASVFALVAGSVLVAQTTQTEPPTPPSPSTQSAPPQAIDQVLVKDPSQLTPNEITGIQKKLADYGQLARYAAANAALPTAPADRVVFFGDSITDAWGNGANAATFFPGKPYLDRGIGGQTTPQMLVRFQQDVVALKPAVVLILAGTNDIAGNTGLETPQHIQDNFRSMATIADANHIQLVLASILPVDDYAWRRGLEPAEKVRSMNAWLKQFCADHNYIYLDYYTSLATPEGAMKPGLSRDGVHPTAAGYAIMAPLAQAAIDQAFGKTKR